MSALFSILCSIEHYVRWISRSSQTDHRTSCRARQWKKPFEAIYCLLCLRLISDIKDVSHYQEEEEILFPIHFVVRIQQVKQINEGGRLWQADLHLQG